MPKVIVYDENPDAPAQEVMTELHAVPFGPQDVDGDQPYIGDGVLYYGQPFSQLVAEYIGSTYGKDDEHAASIADAIEGFWIVAKKLHDSTGATNPRMDNDSAIYDVNHTTMVIIKHNALMTINKPKGSDSRTTNNLWQVAYNNVTNIVSVPPYFAEGDVHKFIEAIGIAGDIKATKIGHTHCEIHNYNGCPVTIMPDITK